MSYYYDDGKTFEERVRYASYELPYSECCCGDCEPERAIEPSNAMHYAAQEIYRLALTLRDRVEQQDLIDRAYEISPYLKQLHEIEEKHRAQYERTKEMRARLDQQLTRNLMIDDTSHLW